MTGTIEWHISGPDDPLAIELGMFLASTSDPHIPTSIPWGGPAVVLGYFGAHQFDLLAVLQGDGSPRDGVVGLAESLQRHPVMPHWHAVQALVLVCEGPGRVVSADNRHEFGIGYDPADDPLARNCRSVFANHPTGWLLGIHFEGTTEVELRLHDHDDLHLVHCPVEPMTRCWDAIQNQARARSN